MSPELDRTVAFLKEIGLPVTVDATLRGEAFFERVQIEAGSLRVHPEALVSDVLHEAGHLAVVPARWRHLIDGNVDEGIQRMFEEADRLDLPPDGPESRALLQAGEAEATAWAWAAGKHLGFPDDTIIRDSDYSNEGPWIRRGLALDEYLGINGLCYAGFCGRGLLGRRKKLPIYPNLAFWLQDGPAPLP